MRIWATRAARIFRVSRIFRANGTLAYSWVLRDTAAMGIAVAAAHTTLRHPDPESRYGVTPIGS